MYQKYGLYNIKNVDKTLLAAIKNNSYFFELDMTKIKYYIHKFPELLKYLYIKPGIESLVLFDPETYTFLTLSTQLFSYDPNSAIKTFNHFKSTNYDKIIINDLESVLTYIPSAYKMFIFNLMLEDEIISDNNTIKHLFLLAYSSSEYDFDYEQIKELLNNIKSDNNDDLIELSNIFKDDIEIFRGSTNSSTNIEDALSWSTDFKIAKFFSDRFDSNGVVYRGIVNIKDVLGYNNNRGESEILVDFNSIKDIKIINLEISDKT